MNTGDGVPLDNLLETANEAERPPSRRRPLMVVGVVCLAIALVSFGIAVWEGNPDDRALAMSIYVGCAAIAPVILPAAISMAERFWDHF